MKKLIASALSLVLLFSLAACTPASTNNGDSTASNSQSAKELSIAYQYGISYAPLLVAMEQKLIEQCYDGEVNITWTQLNSGAAINEAFAAGNVDIAAMGLGPAISGIMKKLPYKIFSNMSAQPHKLMTTSSSINSLADIDDEQIALVNIGSIQHILLAMACKEELGDAHALDDNIAVMSHPDGMTALLSGSVSIQLTTSPYIFQELKSQDKEVSVLYDLAKVWPQGNSFIVSLASNTLFSTEPELFNAVCEAIEKAMDFINTDREGAAALLAGLMEADEADMLEWLSDPGCVYEPDTKGVMDFASFMAEEGFIDEGPSELSELVYSNVLESGNAS